MSAALPSLRLYTSNGSPFCLKVMILARELGLIDSITLDYSVVPHPSVPSRLCPYACPTFSQLTPVLQHSTLSTTSHSALIPTGKIPCLLVNESTPLYGSSVIAQYLVSLKEGKGKGEEEEEGAGTKALERFEKLTTEALADGMCEAALLLRYERLDRPVELHNLEWITGQLSKITRAIPILAKRALPAPEVAQGQFGLDGIAAAIALNYMDKRAPDAGWRDLEGGKALDEWLLKVKERKSWKETHFA